MEANKINKNKVPELLTSLGYTAIPLRQNMAGHLIINVKINGVDGIYLLDTGAGTTVIDNNQADNLKLKVNLEEVVTTGGGVGAQGMENYPSHNNTIEISNFKIDKFTVAVMSLETAWQTLSAVGAHDKLFGIIGFDILNSGNAIIDYGSMLLYLLQPEN